MALFRRKKSDDQTIADLESYYANQSGTRTGMAWAMAFLSLLITVAVITGLFFGGRWIYRTLTDNDTEVATTSTEESTDTELPSFTESDEQTEADNNTSDDILGENSENADGTDTNEGVVSDEAASTDTPSSERSTSNSSNSSNGSVAGDTTPRTGDSDELPNTGAGETIVFILVGTTIFGYAVARKTQTRP